MHGYGDVAIMLLRQGMCSPVSRSNCFHSTLQTLTNQKGEKKNKKNKKRPAYMTDWLTTFLCRINTWHPRSYNQLGKVNV